MPYAVAMNMDNTDNGITWKKPRISSDITFGIQNWRFQNEMSRLNLSILCNLTRGSSIGGVFAWHASGPEFDPHVRHILSWRLDHETFLRPFSLFRWFKKSSYQLLTKECALSTGKLPRRLAQEQCGLVNWPRPKWPKMCWRAVKQKSNQPITLFVGYYQSK